MSEILVVCTANVCRSPVVEALLRRDLGRLGRGHWRVSSGGLMGVDGWAAAALSAELAQERGLDLSSHRSSRLTADRLASASLVIAMTSSHVAELAALFPGAAPRVHRLASLAGDERDVPDPYGGPRSGYEVMVADVEDLVRRGLDRIVELADPS